MKDFKALATERYSVRKFNTKPVEQDYLRGSKISAYSS